MKIAIIGGGGVRTPQLIPSLIRRAERLQLSELWLMDNDADKLALIGGLCQALAEQYHAPFSVHLTTDADQAIRGAAHVITSIRPGKEAGRARDERIAFSFGVLGQETTGAAGMAMAMRSLPAILAYARRVQEIGAPGAWIYNFTNPAGLVAQGLHDAGIDRVVGICDSANGAQHAASRFLGIDETRVRHEVYGLNHLSWTNSVKIDASTDGSNGEEVLPALLSDPAFIASTHLKIFDPDLLVWQGAFLNEYLHYFFHRDESLKALLAKPETRGEQVERLTRDLLERLNAAQSIQDRLAVYHAVMNERSATYMAHATSSKNVGAEFIPPATPEVEDEGYAGVALGCVEAIISNTPRFTGINVPNRGAIPQLDPDDVVEISGWIDADGFRPIHVENIPAHQLALIRSVKAYERLAVQGILTGDRHLLIDALTTHPLVGSYPLARKLVDAFIEAWGMPEPSV